MSRVRGRRRFPVGWVFALPWVVGFGVFLGYPIVASLYYSFCDYSILTGSVFIGTENYEKLWRDDVFWRSLTNTLIVAGCSVPLGLMVSLARDVRTRSAERLTKDLLRRLDTLVAQYKSRSLKELTPPQRRNYPVATLLIDGPLVPDESRLRDVANKNNHDVIRCLRQQTDLSNTTFSDLSIANYNEANVLDAWGSPIVFMPYQHPLIGMAGGDRSFFFSAGPDRQYLTRQDNLYSYETGPIGE